MNDTTTITAEEREMWASIATARINAVMPERQCEITAQERLVKSLKALEQAESRAEKSEAENTRLTKMVDWLASHTADICASVYQDSYDLHWWTDCEWKEAALRAVAAGEETYQK